MRYSDSLRYLNSFLNLERILFTPNNRIWNLDRMRKLLGWFGHPERKFFSVLIAGTKGKGSTGFFLESILKASGIRTGFYSSPHLEDPRERIRIDGEMISRSKWIKTVEAIRRGLLRKKLPQSLGEFTYFEILTLLAILSFKQENIHIGIFEAGMGGRLDATRALNPSMALLTPIHLDHEAMLGNTIAKIAREKAAIIETDANVIVGPQPVPAKREIIRQIRKQKARLWNAKAVSGKVGLRGDYQKINAGIAAKAASLLKDAYGFKIPGAAVRTGLKKSDWPGRFETIRKNSCEFLLDGAHNPISVEALTRNLKKMYPKRDRLLVFACSRDKKSERMLAALSGYFPRIVLTSAANLRSQEAGVLLVQARRFFREIFPVSGMDETFSLIRKLSNAGTLVVITGSFYLVGAARQFIYRKR